jgi:hypothetical protein
MTWNRMTAPFFFGFCPTSEGAQALRPRCRHRVAAVDGILYISVVDLTLIRLSHPTRITMSSRLLLSVLGILALSACDNLGISGEPNTLAVYLDATGATQVALVTSTDWILAPDPDCDPNGGQCPETVNVLTADTVTVALPSEKTFYFTNDFRYWVEAFPTGGVTATVHMRIEIDGDEWYNQSGTLKPDGDGGEQETLSFVYQWQKPGIY